MGISNNQIPTPVRKHCDGNVIHIFNADFSGWKNHAIIFVDIIVVEENFGSAMNQCICGSFFIVDVENVFEFCLQIILVRRNLDFY